MQQIAILFFSRYHLTWQFVKELRSDRETLKDDELREVCSDYFCVFLL